MRTRGQAQYAAILATEARDAVYGKRERPFGWRLRLDWASVCGTYRRSGSLESADVLRIARTLGDDLRRNGATLEATPEVDAGIRVELAARLRAEAKRLNRPRLTSAQRREGRIKTLAKG